MKKDEILNIAKKTFKKFPHPIEKPIFKTFKKDKFASFLKDSALKVRLETTPAFVAHLPTGELVVFCTSILNHFAKKTQSEKQFVEAITMHELYHIWNHYRCITADEALRSEEEVHTELAKEFPQLSQILEQFH